MARKFNSNTFLDGAYSGTEKSKEIERLQKEVEQLKEQQQQEPTQLKTELIIPSVDQPRRYFDSDSMQSLVESVKQHGILQPLLVRPQKGGKYQLIAGERRYRAALETGKTAVPVVIKELSDEEASQVALIENLQREDLNPVEETEAILQLLVLHTRSDLEKVTTLLHRMYNEGKGKVTYNVVGNSEAKIVESLFTTIGRLTWQSFVVHRLPLLNLPPEILEILRAGKIEYTKAKAIAKIKDESARKNLLEEAISQSLSLSQIKERIKLIQTVTTQNSSVASKQRFDDAIKKAKKAKVWEDPLIWKDVESLIARIEQLLEQKK